MRIPDCPTFLYSIGHSTHTIDHFISLLKKHDIQVIADVRSMPFSRRNPQFSRETLVRNLKDNGIGYTFLGKELGARRDEPECYQNGKVDYDQVVKTSAFQEGISRLVESSLKFRTAMLCAEKDPLTCHRAILVARNVKEFVGEVRHILANGNIETQEQAEERLIIENNGQSTNFFVNREKLISDAYRQRGKDISYEEPIPHG